MCIRDRSYNGQFDLNKINDSNLINQIEVAMVSNNGEGIIINEKIHIILFCYL